jgi:enoyl-CoA hydratase/carnithine racemase
VPSSDASPLVQTDFTDELLTVTLNRPQRRNALDPAMRDALAAALDDAARTPAIRGVVITGRGDAFCAGGDLGAFEDLHARPLLYRHVSHELTAMLDGVERLEKPVVAALNGVATGAGLTLALCCDWRVASPAARLLFREGRLGLVPTHGGVTRLVKLVGVARAKEALLGGDDLDAAAALRLGLVSELAEGDLVAAARARARRMLGRAPLSYGAAKRLVALAADADVRSGILAESLAQTALLGSEDHREGLAAAREKRDPEFAGR